MLQTSWFDHTGTGSLEHFLVILINILGSLCCTVCGHNAVLECMNECLENHEGFHVVMKLFDHHHFRGLLCQNVNKKVTDMQRMYIFFSFIFHLI